MGELGSWGAKCQSSLTPPWVGGAGLRREVIHCESQLPLSLSLCVCLFLICLFRRRRHISQEGPLLAAQLGPAFSSPGLRGE